MVTSGALHGMDLVVRVMVGPGDVVAVEEPGYPPAVKLLRSHGLAVVGVPVDAHGLVVDAIPSSARLVYVTPSHQYPLGVVLSHERRLQLLRWAARHDATIVEDDYDSQFRYATRPLEPLQRLDPDGRVVYLGTLSKVLSPSLRVGFAVVPRSILPAVSALRQAVDWCPPWPTQPTLTRLIARRPPRSAHRPSHPAVPCPAGGDRAPPTVLAGAGAAPAVIGRTALRRARRWDRRRPRPRTTRSIAEDLLVGSLAALLPVQPRSRRRARRIRRDPG